MGTNRYGKDELVKRVTMLIEGLDQFAAGAPPLTLVGQTVTSAEARAKLQAIVDLRQRVADARGQLQAALADEEAQLPDLIAFASAFRAQAKLTYSTRPTALAAHGIHVKARAPTSVEAQTAAVAKRAATRKARHTMGPRQKAKIKGDVIGVEVEPVRATATEPAPDRG
jgi:hypothetical protein